MRPRPNFKRPDLIYRNLHSRRDDQSFDVITRRVIQFLEGTPIDEWNKDAWAAYRALLTQNAKTPLVSADGKAESMSTEELQKLTSLGEVSNS